MENIYAEYKYFHQKLRHVILRVKNNRTIKTVIQVIKKVTLNRLIYITQFISLSIYIFIIT